ncbi:DNA mismatch repair protein MSH6 [Cannabis sativa]|uniref:DNA mismatch repair protein MSH6 n=1 Tax=Cannabis sativa TaxID=3483 RepID=UPI0029CA0282|nr:DNA mismatch repair protein MSH6 [Cannabis sativa]
MSSSRRQTNGRSPLVNQQRQITAFFSKSPTSSSDQKLNNPTPKSKLKPVSSDQKRSPSPSPVTPSPLQSKLKKPLLVIAASSPSSITSTSASDKPYGEEAVGKKIKVYWPLDESWYEGFVKLFDKDQGRHLVQYDDAEEELLDLAKEKIEWVEQSAKKLKRLRRGSSLSMRKMIIDDEDEAENLEDEEEGDSDGSGADDSSDEDWGKSGEKMVTENSEEEDMEMVLEDEDEKDEALRCKGKLGGEGKSNKRKSGGAVEFDSAKKSKGSKDVNKGGSKVSIMRTTPTDNAENVKCSNAVNADLSGDASERFSIREAKKLHFLGDERRDANRRRPGDPNYDPKTLFLPPIFVKSLSDGQRQWWEFKSKHMDKVLFFKMGKFYELFEMDAHVGAKELGLQYMKGEQPHCGFPEKNFSVNVEKLARKGYRVLVVEQTETPDQLEFRRREKGSKDKVVRREICGVVTKGTLTEGEMLSTNPDASYIMALTESQNVGTQNVERNFGVCVVDVATSRVILGQFHDDSECSALSCLLSELRPVEIVQPAKQLSLETEKVLLRHTRSPLVNELVPGLEFWDAEKTIHEVKGIYERASDQSVSSSSSRKDLNVKNYSTEEELSHLPDVLVELIRAGENGSYALSALGGTLFYLKQAFLDETLLRYAKFELLPSSGFCDLISKPFLVLDAAALENLEIFENSRNGDSFGTLYAQLNHCVTAFGKRLLKTWLARPLYHVESIKERQKAVASLRGVNLPLSFEYRKALSRLPDMERLLPRVFSISEANGRNANKVTLYEDAAKKQLQEFISALRGCELMVQACSSFGAILENVESRQLHHLLSSGIPHIDPVLTHFKDAFDWMEANDSGRIIPHEGVDIEYDSACKKVKEIESSLAKYLKEQCKLLGDTSIAYVTVGKDTYLLEVPESLRGRVPRDYELRSSKKGFFRYWTPNIKKFLGELAQAESEKESSLKSILQRLIGRFCEHHTMWRQLVSTTAELDVLISLAIASDFYEGPTCQPTILSSSTDEVPRLSAKSLGHPVLRSDSLGKGSFVPNDVTIGGSGNPSFILLTGPNMGGKSTLLRQVCLTVILAQLGADVPAERFELSPVDRIFVRMGAKDHIMAGQSTFLTELSETAMMLSSATHNSLVALDELGRGTSTSDGQAIAGSVLEHFVHKVQCRGMFSTHYHRLAIDYQKDPKVQLCHMACQVGSSVGAIEEVTFLYRLTHGACPKSYGVNVARLAGLPNSVLENAAIRSTNFEAIYGKHRKPVNNLSELSSAEKMVLLVQKLNSIISNLKFEESMESIGVSSFIELQREARVLCEINSR